VRCATRSGIVSVWVGQWSHLGKPNEDEAPTRPARPGGAFSVTKKPNVRLGVEVVGLLRFGGNGRPGYGNTHNGPT
jgi:hypothetical protein